MVSGLGLGVWSLGFGFWVWGVGCGVNQQLYGDEPDVSQVDEVADHVRFCVAHLQRVPGAMRVQG